jgi:hypothetical protein
MNEVNLEQARRPIVLTKLCRLEEAIGAVWREQELAMRISTRASSDLIYFCLCS